ncbi:MAG: zinc ribbon domain-containing protein [Chloroflexaceae bacterium]|nr:zinc ribbon domain-containing protein [Chloroflexaceae bacterium]
MSFLDQLGRSASQMVDRAKFEAEKFQRTTRLQGEIGELRHQIHSKLAELGQRTYELHRAGQINSATIAALAQAIDQLRIDLTKREEELSIPRPRYLLSRPPPQVRRQGVPLPRSQHVPVEDEPPPPPPPATPPPPQAQTGKTQPDLSAGDTKTCPSCSYTMPMRAIFCPNCGFRIGNK